MTLPSTPFRADHTGNGTTGPFLYDWKILSNTHLRVIRQVIATGIETVLVLGVDYSVTGVGNDGGGNINLTDALPGTEKITILPNVPYEQDTDFTNQNSVKPEEAENMADKLGRQIKQVVEELSRAVKLPPSSTESPINYISQMNQIYADTVAAKNTTENARDTVLNNSGFIVVSADLLGSDTIGTVAADITNVNTAAGSIANINTVAGSIGSVNIVAADIANINTVATDIASVNSAAANMAAIIAAPTQAANAASSAALSQSWAVDAIGARPEGSAKYWSEVAQGFAAAINLPSAVGNALRFLRQKADETGFEYRTAAQVRSDIGAATSTQGALADRLLVSNKNRVLNGLTIKNNVTDATNDIDIAVGSAVSDDGTTIMEVTNGAFYKRLDAAWAVGNGAGGLDTGEIADGHYFVWLIHRTDTGVTDVLFSTSGTAPTMPANYTKKKRIGSFMRISGAIRPFLQKGNEFYFLERVLDWSANISTTDVPVTLSVPKGEKIETQIFVSSNRGGGGTGATYVTDGDYSTDSTSLWGLTSGASAAYTSVSGKILTSTTGTINIRTNINQLVKVTTVSYTDRGI